jgi:FAD:protein FMN transferase
MNSIKKRMRPLLGCFVEIAVVTGTAPEHLAIDAAFTRIELIQHLLSFHEPNSNLSQLNGAQGRAVNIHPLSIQCLGLAKAITRISRGCFNCTLGATLTALDVLPQHNFKKLYGNTLLPYGSWSDIELTRCTARLRRPVLITLDGIAKGFAVDCAIAELKRLGAVSGWINAGGDIGVFGDLVLPIDVRDHNGTLYSMGGLQNAAIATSTSKVTPEFPGVLLDAFAKQIAPMTSTVVARSAWRADALTKVAAATQAPKRAETITRLGGRWVSFL